ncbi:MAG: nickel pincer cofactor biosynthesis protein LarC [Candidatus Omnitrophica bacterium]|nr:nickel pincer cofactor biosynthesis protein LarC [Candidatus Omnitrophota bacterium]
MKIAYFDCFCGISGDMILGAFLDCGLDIEDLRKELNKLKLSDYQIKIEKVKKGVISGTKFSVDIKKQKIERSLKDILKIIGESNLDADIKKSSRETFELLAKVEAEIHNQDIEKIHFHEVGAVDSIVDIVGAFIGIKLLGIECIYSSKIHVGDGFVRCQHGTLPVPSPATIALLKGIPIYSKGIDSELVTPTGACIIRKVSKGFGLLPDMEIKKIGYGGGRKDLSIPNLLRIFIGETEEDNIYDNDEVILIETNIDDMSPEAVGYISERLLSRDALDVFTTPIFMKKNRPAVTLSILTEPSKLDDMLSCLFSETTTFGIRMRGFKRRKLLRKIAMIDTKFGPIAVKVGRTSEGIKTIAPEYESCKQVAQKENIPFKNIYSEVKKIADQVLKET